MLRAPAFLLALPSSMRRRRHVSRPLDPVTVAALRTLLAPPAESEADAERAVADIMAHVLAARAADTVVAEPADAATAGA